MSRFNVSVVVPARNSENTIDLCIGSLMKQDFPHLEIVAVDNMSNDRTAKRISKYPVNLVYERNVNSYAARNAGIRATQGEIVAFLDADCIPKPNWISSLVKSYRNEHIGGAGGQVLPYTNYKPKNVIERYTISAKCYPAYPYKTEEPITLKRQKGVLLAGVLFTANASYRRSILEKLGGFDESQKSGGDIDMSYRVQDLGYRLIWNPDACVFHIQRSTCRDLIQQYFRYGTCVAPLVKRHFPDARYIVSEHYLSIVRNSLIFLSRLLRSPFCRNDRGLYLASPMLDNLTVIALVAGKFYGNFRVRVFIL